MRAVVEPVEGVQRVRRAPGLGLADLQRVDQRQAEEVLVEAPASPRSRGSGRRCGAACGSWLDRSSASVAPRSGRRQSSPSTRAHAEAGADAAAETSSAASTERAPAEDERRGTRAPTRHLSGTRRTSMAMKTALSTTACSQQQGPGVGVDELQQEGDKKIVSSGCRMFSRKALTTRRAALARPARSSSTKTPSGRATSTTRPSGRVTAGQLRRLEGEGADAVERRRPRGACSRGPARCRRCGRAQTRRCATRAAARGQWGRCRRRRCLGSRTTTSDVTRNPVLITGPPDTADGNGASNCPSSCDQPGRSGCAGGAMTPRCTSSR